MGRFVAVARRDLGLTQPELARKAGVNEATVYRLESGQIRRPGRDVCLAVARALRQPASTMLALAGHLPDPLGRQFQRLSEGGGPFDDAAAFAALMASVVRLVLSRPDDSLRRVAVGLAAAARLRSGRSLELVASEGRRLAWTPDMAVMDAAEQGDLGAVRMQGNDAWLGWFLGAGADPDEGFFVLGRFPEDLIEDAGLRERAAAWQAALREASSLAERWRKGAPDPEEAGEAERPLAEAWRRDGALGGVYGLYEVFASRARDAAGGEAAGGAAGAGPAAAGHEERAEGPEDGDLWRALSAGGERTEGLWGALSRLALEEYRGLAGEEDRTRLVELILCFVRWAWWGRGSDARVADFRAALRPAPGPDGFAAWLRRRDEPLDRLAVGLGALVWRRMDLLWPVLRAAGAGAVAARAPLRFRLAEHPDAAPEEVLGMLGSAVGEEVC
ncbi:MAG: helix-turn-helix transcriptional regulator [Firmicutes bacterium]|nr:helix-turn-helix transcriptional regulator [Bacillota bacterium]